MLIRHLTAVMILILVGGCTHLEPGSVRSLSEAHPQPNVIIIRGYNDWYSSGIDDLAADLRSHGIHAQAFAEAQSNDVQDALLNSPPAKPLVLIGYSYGANDVVSIAHQLGDHHIDVDLLITMDPIVPTKGIPANVHRCENFYRTASVLWWYPFPPGIPLHKDDDANDTKLTNIDIRNEPDLAEPDMSHATIPYNLKLRAAIVKLVVETCLPQNAAATRP
jgi:pimeloyl-ACP methyl ester carboxylesterase